MINNEEFTHDKKNIRISSPLIAGICERKQTRMSNLLRCLYSRRCSLLHWNKLLHLYLFTIGLRSSFTE